MKNGVILIALSLVFCFSASGVTQAPPAATPDKQVSGSAAGKKAARDLKAANDAQTIAESKLAARQKAAPPYGFWITYSAMGVLLIVLSLAILRGLKNWSLSEALSEDGKASISRLLALLGFAVIISIYLGTGCGVIFRILDGGTVTDLGSLGTFLAGGAALFTPYIANQIKGAVTGVVNGPLPTSGAQAITATAFSPKNIKSGSPRTISISGTNLALIQGAICTDQNGAEHPLPSTSVNVLNAGAVEITLAMDPPQIAAAPYQSTLTLLTKDGQRIPVGNFTVG